MNLTVETRSSDNLLLCQFMVNYELRQGEYLVALDSKQQIIAAGVLFQQYDDEAQVDIVVAPNARQQGVGRYLVTQLIEQASGLGLHRVIAHSVAPFWLAQDFTQVGGNQFAYVLPQAANALIDLWHNEIPMAQFIGLAIVDFDHHSVSTTASMKASINVHQSMFAGAVYSQAVLTGWGLLHLALIRYGLTGSIVLADGAINYRRPITRSPSGKVCQSMLLSDFDSLIAGKNNSIELTVMMSDGDSDKASATFTGRYVIIPVTND